MTKKRVALTRGMVALLTVGLVTILLTSFSTWALFRYSRIAGQAATGAGASYEAIMQSAILPGHLSGIDLPERGVFLYASKNISFVPIVVLLAGVGGLIYSIYKRSWQSLALVIFGLYTFFVSASPKLFYTLRSSVSYLLSGVFSLRYLLVPLRIALPILAGLGVVAVVELGFFWLKGKYLGGVKKVLVAAGGLIMFVLVLVNFGNFPEPMGDKYRFGPRGLDLGNIWQDEHVEKLDMELDLTEQLDPANWPEFQLATMPEMPTEGVLKMIEQDNPRARIDFSPQASSHSMIAPYFNLDTNLSQIHTYVPTTSLMLRFTGQQSNAFYANDPFYGNDVTLINDWTRWFGITHIWLSGQEDEAVHKLLAETGWMELSGVVGTGVLKYPEDNSLVELSNKKAVLVISQDRLGAYDQIYRLAGHGVLPFEETLLVRGRGKVDSYSQEELSRFDVLLLDGYGYDNFGRANVLLSEYVKSGGGVFIDTGWEYEVPDWETQERGQPLEMIPVEKLSWKDLGKISNYALTESNLSQDVDTKQFAPLAYGDQPWSVSTAERTEIKDWASPVLGTGNNLLVVQGRLGQGKVVWSGMNLVAHAKQGDSFYWEEIKLLVNMFAWLTEGGVSQNWAVSYLRQSPDEVEFTINEDLPTGGWLLWKEARHPDFQARLSNNSSSLPVYRAGPGMTLIRVPQVTRGDKISYEYHQPLIEIVVKIISLVTLILLLPLIVIDGFWRKRSILARLTNWQVEILDYLIFRVWKLPFQWWKKDDHEEE
jgi:hypothetical protein